MKTLMSFESLQDANEWLAGVDQAQHTVLQVMMGPSNSVVMLVEETAPPE